MSTDTDADGESAPWHDEDELRRLYVERDLERTEVARRLGCTKSTIDDWLAKYGITKRWSKPWHDEETLRELYIEREWNDSEIADHFNVNQSTISKARQKFGIETRDDLRYSYSRSELISHLQRLNDEKEYRVTTGDVDDDEDAPASSSYSNRFGSFAEALEAAGIDPDAPTRPSSYRDSIEVPAAALLTSDKDLCRKVLDVPEPFRLSQTDLSQAELRRLQEAGVVEVEGRCLNNPDVPSNSTCYEWCIVDGIIEWIDTTWDFSPSRSCPECDAIGIQNLGDGRYTCSSDDCDSNFGRETAREVLGQ